MYPVHLHNLSVSGNWRTPRQFTQNEHPSYFASSEHENARNCWIDPVCVDSNIPIETIYHNAYTTNLD